MIGCPRSCDDRGLRWVIEEDPETGIWYTVGYPCDHQPPPARHGVLLAAVAILALVLGLLPSLIVGVLP